MTNINFDAAFIDETPFDSQKELIKVKYSNDAKIPDIVDETPFDSQKELIKVKYSFEDLEKQMIRMRDDVFDIQVNTKEDFKLASEKLIQCRQFNKIIENAKKNNKTLKEASVLVNSVNKFIRENFTEKIKGIENEIDKKIKGYLNAEAELQRRIEEKRRKEAEEERRKLIEEERKKAKERFEKERQAAIERQKKLDEEAKKAGVESVKIEMPEEPDETDINIPEIVIEPSAQEDNKIGIDGDTVKYDKKTMFEIINPDEVEREYCLPDKKLIQKAIDSGVKNIKGVKIWEDYAPRTRISNKTNWQNKSIG